MLLHTLRRMITDDKILEILQERIRFVIRAFVDSLGHELRRNTQNDDPVEAINHQRAYIRKPLFIVLNSSEDINVSKQISALEVLRQHLTQTVEHLEKQVSKKKQTFLLVSYQLFWLFS